MATTDIVKPKKKSKSTSRKRSGSGSTTPPQWKPLVDVIECGKKSPYLWSLPAGLITSQEADRLSGWCAVAQLKSKFSKEAVADCQSWVESDSEPRALEVVHGLQALWLVAKLTRDGEADLAERIVTRAAQAINHSSAAATDSIWHQFLCEVELPLTLAAIGYPEVPKTTSKHYSARITELVDEVCDTDGVPHAEHLQYLRPLLAAWTRSLALAENLKLDLRKKKVQAVYDALLEQCLRFSTYDRGSLGCRSSEFDFSKRMFQQAISWSSDADIELISEGALGFGRKTRLSMLDGLTSAATHSEWGSIAVLRSHWSRTSPKLLIDYSNDALHCHLDTIKSLLDGAWVIRIDRNGKTLLPTADWNLVCWHDDDDSTYLELERDYEQGTRLQRQILLGCEDSVLFVADAVFFDEPCEWDYRLEMKMASGVELVGGEETREAHLVHHDENGATTPLGLVIPLSFPEWRQESIDAGLQEEDHSLVHFGHRCSARGYFPLFLDMNPVRSQNALTWRRLTVGESLEICPEDVAVAYRVQVGQEQWIFYRALSSTGNRTFLGQNVFADFFAGQFDADGQVNELITINEDEDE